jgi:hypothetical protein
MWLVVSGSLLVRGGGIKGRKVEKSKSRIARPQLPEGLVRCGWSKQRVVVSQYSRVEVLRVAPHSELRLRRRRGRSCRRRMRLRRRRGDGANRDAVITSLKDNKKERGGD